MSIEFRLPELGENIEEAEIAEVLVKEGDHIDAEQSVMELETEKAVLELPCPHAGRVTKIHVSEGESVKVGSVILTIDDAADGEAAESAATTEATAPPAQPEHSPPAEAVVEEADPPAQTVAITEEKPSPARTGPPSDTMGLTDQPPPPAGPATRRFARKLGVDLHAVTGTGPEGRISEEDVQDYVRNRFQAADAASPVRAVPPLPDFTQFGPVERQRLNKLSRTAADQLSTSWQVIPHVTQHDSADITELEAVRRQYLETTGKSGPKITMTAIAIKACVQILTEMPQVNSSLDVETGELILKQYYHIGVAVDTEHGLVVPVVQDADRKSILEIADELTQLAERARERKLVLAEMQGATFTITNLGGIGGTAFTPIVNYPEVAILGMSRARKQPTLADGELQERLMLPLSLSYDHRVINGADAARFVVRLSALLAQPFGLLANV